MSVIDRMPASVKLVPEAAQAWEDLAKLVKDESNPVVLLPAEDKRDLDLLTQIGGITVTAKDGAREVTLLVETAAPAAEKPATAVKEAAAAESSFADGEEQRRRE